MTWNKVSSDKLTEISSGYDTIDKLAEKSHRVNSAQGFLVPTLKDYLSTGKTNGITELIRDIRLTLRCISTCHIRFSKLILFLCLQITWKSNGA